MNQSKIKLPRIAVIGCGYWGKNLIRNFADLGVLCGVCDINLEIANKYAMQYGVDPFSITALLSNSEIDAVAIATPAVTHFSVVENALESGKDVFVEKPIALDLDDALRLKDKARQFNRVLMVGHLLQYHPVFLKLKQLIDEGTFGRLRHIYSHRLNLGKVRREENVLWSFAPHDISMILSLIGSEPCNIIAIGGCYLDEDITDITTTHMSFPGGENAHIFVSWLHPYKEQKLVIVGDECMAVFDDTEDWKRKLLLYPHKFRWENGTPVPSKADAQAVEVEEAEPLKEELKHFIDCLLGKVVCRTDSDEAIRVLRVLKASEQAILEKSNIKIESN